MSRPGAGALRSHRLPWLERSYSDWATCALAAATAGGAALGAAGRLSPPMTPLALAAAVALAVRRPWLLLTCTALLAAALGARAESGRRLPTTGPWSGWVTVVRDPQPAAAGVTADVRVEGKRVLASAHGRASAALQRAEYGDRLQVRGALAALSEPAAGWMRGRHLAGRLQVFEIVAHGPPRAPLRVGNAFRHLLAQGASSLDREARSLYGGFVLGDNRAQSEAVAADFRAAGLTHLLVASGQNVAFVLTAAAPVLNRLGRRSSVVATFATLAVFGGVARWEPSILRATAMAALVVVTRRQGQAHAPVRVLALATTLLLLVDPMLVYSLGFGLSVSATLGIALAARSIENALPGPRWLAEALGVSAAAHLGTGPLLLVTWGSVPAAALATNLFAGPAAGPLMVWGLVAGVAAGFLREIGLGAPATALHLPTRLLVSWVATVARLGAQMPLGEIGPALGALVAVGAATAVLWSKRPGSRWSPPIWLFVAALLAQPALRLAVMAPADDVTISRGVRLYTEGRAWRRSTVVVFERGFDGEAALGALRARGITALDVAVLGPKGASAGAQLRVVLGGMRHGTVVVPADGRLGGLSGRVVLVDRSPVAIRAGPFELDVRPGDPLGVTARQRSATGP